MTMAAPLTQQLRHARSHWQMNLMMLALALLAPRSATPAAGRNEVAPPGGQCAPMCAPHWRSDIGVTSILGIRG